MSAAVSNQQVLQTSAKDADHLFHVTKSGGEESLGPWTIEEIGARLAKAELSFTDFIFDDQKQDWVPLVECEALTSHLRRAKPKAPPKAPSREPSNTVAAAPTPERVILETAIGQADAEWFVQKGANRYGPYTYLSLVKALQTKAVYEFDLVCRAGTEELIRLAEHEAFSPSKLRELHASQLAAADSIFTTREHRRSPFESDVIVNDGRSAWTGRAFEGSVGGSGLIIQNSQLLPGQQLRIHFAPTTGLGSFNVLAEIVNKKFEAKIANQYSPIRYAVRFIQMDSLVSQKIAEHFTRA